MSQLQVMPTGIPNLDPILGGGIPLYSLNIVAGPPGTGKTVFVQNVLFNFIRRMPEAKALYLTTLSEPTLKIVRYMQHYTFFDPEVFGERVLYQDLGRLLHERKLQEVADYILGFVATHNPDLLVIDSFKPIHDLSRELGHFRRFCYDLSMRLASARCTTFLVGEYERREILEGPEFAVADGIIFLDRAREPGVDGRVLQIYKLRGQAAEVAPFPFIVTGAGVTVLAPLPSTPGKNLPPVPASTGADWEKNSTLSHREKEIVRMIVQGMTNQEIAERLLLSLNTIKTHRLRVYQKLGLNSRSELVSYAMQQGFLR